MRRDDWKIQNAKKQQSCPAWVSAYVLEFPPEIMMRSI